jgi:hypothetical protein
MRGFVAILRREVFERRLLVLVALALGLAPVTLPLVPGWQPAGVTPADLRGGMALGLALLLTALLAVVLGGSIVAGDLAERRLGFYFSRPLPGWAVWAGKIGAAVVLVFAAGLLVLAPAALAGGNLNLDGAWGNWGTGGLLNVTAPGVFALWALALVFLLLIAHAASVIIRARSPWALLDLIALSVVAALVLGSLRRLRLAGVLLYAGLATRERQLGIVVWMSLGFLAAVLFALAVAGAVQVIRGRTDLRRAHRVLSLGLWGTLLTAAFLFAGLAAWVLAAGPGDLRGVFEATAGPDLPGGHWIAFTGPAAWRPGYAPTFLHDVDSGRTFRIRSGLVSYSSVYGSYDPMVRFSADGRRAVWLEYDGDPFVSPVVVYRLDLDRAGAAPVRTPVSYQAVPRGFALSPDGRRVAAYEGQWRRARLTVSAVDDGGLLAAALYDSRTETPRLAFAGPDRLRIFEIFYPSYVPGRVGPKTEIFELDLTASSPRPQKTGEIPAMDSGIREWSVAPEGDRILLRSADTLELCDARSGTPLAVLGDGRARGTFLRDRRIAVVEALADKYEHELRIFPPDGRSEPRHISFPKAFTLIVADQPAPGVLRVITSRRGGPPHSRELWQVDLERGTAQPMGARRVAILDLPQVPRSRVDLKGVDGVVWFEPWTSRARVVLKGS